jgi:TonB family protein
VVGDVGDSPTNIPNLSQSASAGRIGSNLQLLSDAKGVDFKPYLIQVLAAVRRNWLVIIPESARLGRRGRVLIQFAIDRTGAVPKLVIAEGAGTDALDRAAVAAISASYPFPPLPPDYKGDQIRLQLAFAYNMPTK